MKANSLSIKGMSTTYEDKSYHRQTGTVYSLPSVLLTLLKISKVGARICQES